MDYFVFVYVIKSLRNLSNDKFSQIFIDILLLTDKVVQLSRDAELENQVDALFITEEGVHFNNVWMV